MRLVSVCEASMVLLPVRHDVAPNESDEANVNDANERIFVFIIVVLVLLFSEIAQV